MRRKQAKRTAFRRPFQGTGAVCKVLDGGAKGIHATTNNPFTNQDSRKHQQNQSDSKASLTLSPKPTNPKDEFESWPARGACSTFIPKRGSGAVPLGAPLAGVPKMFPPTFTMHPGGRFGRKQSSLKVGISKERSCCSGLGEKQGCPKDGLEICPCSCARHSQAVCFSLTVSPRESKSSKVSSAQKKMDTTPMSRVLTFFHRRVLRFGFGGGQNAITPPQPPPQSVTGISRSLAYRHETDWTTHGKPEVISIFISIIFSFGRPLRISSLRIRMRLSGGASKAAVRGCCSPIKALANEARAGFGCGQKPARGQRRAADKAGRSDRWAVLLLRLHCRRPSAPLFWWKWRGLITTHSCVAFLASSMTPH